MKMATGSNGSGQSPMMSFCEHSDEQLESTKTGKLLTIFVSSTECKEGYKGVVVFDGFMFKTGFVKIRHLFQPLL
jgi:hypothetical protein